MNGHMSYCQQENEADEMQATTISSRDELTTLHGMATRSES
jgi:hypothetical protein